MTSRWPTHIRARVCWSAARWSRDRMCSVQLHPLEGFVALRRNVSGLAQLMDNAFSSS